MFSPQIFQENTFLKTKPNFPFTGKCFPLTNFPIGKQTQESLESDFPETTFRKTNTAKRKTLSWKPNQFFFLLKLTGKYFPLTNFPNDKQTQESLENGFPKTTFRKTNMALILHLKLKGTKATHYFVILAGLVRDCDNNYGSKCFILEIHQNNVLFFLFFKNYFLDQHIKMI